MIDLVEKDVQEITAYFAYKASKLLFDHDKIAGEQKESREMKELDICWIKRLSSEDYRTDQRNHASAIAGKKLANIPFIKKQIELVNNRKMEEVAKKMSMEHRTIQQTFTKLVFYHFMLVCSKEESEILIGIMGGSFYRLPLIQKNRSILLWFEVERIAKRFLLNLLCNRYFTGNFAFMIRVPLKLSA